MLTWDLSKETPCAYAQGACGLLYGAVLTYVESRQSRLTSETLTRHLAVQRRPRR